MSETEFDSYLSLLSKFLRLRSRQRAELADELRDHLDSRLDELLAQGKTRDQAIKIALEEFGDAAVLAEDFSRLASRRNRRFVMRCTAASAAVVAAVVLLSLAFAPPGPNGPGPQDIVAQQPASEDAGEIKAPPDSQERERDASSVEQQAVAELDQKLGQIIPAVKFVETPLTDVLTFVADAVEVDALIDKQGLEEAGLTADVPVTLSLTRTKLSARTVLDFVLQPHDLTFVNRAGVIFVTTEERAEEHLTTKVYNVRDLLENATSHYEVSPNIIGGGFGGAAGGLGGGEGGMGGGGLGGGGTGGGGFFSVPDMAAAGMLLNSVGQFGGGGLPQPVPTGPATDLIQAVQKSTSGNWMDIDGVGGTLSLFNGLLVVRQTDDVHAQVQKLLDALREAGHAEPGGSVTVPKEGESDANAKHTSWPALGLKTMIVAGPSWVESSGKKRSQIAGLQIEALDEHGLAAAAGFQVGDIVLSWSADKWSRNSIDNNSIASGGAALAMPTEEDLESAPGHGTTAIVFAVTRADENSVRRYLGVRLPIGNEDVAEH